MRKLGTPIGAGPNSAIVASGLAAVGAPPGPKAEPPFGPSFGGWVPAVAGGALVPPPLGALAAARPWLRFAPPLASLSASEASRAAPLRTPPLPSAPRPAASPSAGAEPASPPPLFSPPPSSGPSLSSPGDSQPGSSMSTSPSPSSSTPLEQAGACGDGAWLSEGVVAGPAVARPSPRPAEESAPAMPTPSAVTSPKPVRATISASFCLMRSPRRRAREPLPVSTLSPSMKQAPSY